MKKVNTSSQDLRNANIRHLPLQIVLSQSFTRIRGFVIFARISNLKSFLSIETIAAYYRYSYWQELYIYMSSFILSSWGKALIPFFHSVSIKLLDFFRSVYCSLNLFQALSKAVDQNWVHFTLSDFSFLFEFLLTGTQSNSCLCNRTLYSQLFRDNWSIIDILNILPVLLLIQESLQVLESLKVH